MLILNQYLAIMYHIDTQWYTTITECSESILASLRVQRLRALKWPSMFCDPVAEFARQGVSLKESSLVAGRAGMPSSLLTQCPDQLDNAEFQISIF